MSEATDAADRVYKRLSALIAGLYLAAAATGFVLGLACCPDRAVPCAAAGDCPMLMRCNVAAQKCEPCDAPTRQGECAP